MILCIKCCREKRKDEKEWWLVYNNGSRCTCNRTLTIYHEKYKTQCTFATHGCFCTRWWRGECDNCLNIHDDAIEEEEEEEEEEDMNEIEDDNDEGVADLEEDDEDLGLHSINIELEPTDNVKFRYGVLEIEIRYIEWELEDILDEMESIKKMMRLVACVSITPLDLFNKLWISVEKIDAIQQQMCNINYGSAIMLRRCYRQIEHFNVILKQSVLKLQALVKHKDILKELKEEFVEEDYIVVRPNVTERLCNRLYQKHYMEDEEKIGLADINVHQPPSAVVYARWILIYLNILHRMQSSSLYERST